MENPAFGADSHKNNSNKLKRRRGFRRKAEKRPYSPKTAAVSPYSYAGDTTICGKKIKHGGQEIPAIRPRGRAGRRMPRYPLCAGKHKRGCTDSNGVPPKRGAVKAAVRRSTDCRYIHRRRKRCVGRCNRRPSAPSSQPAQHGAQARLHALRNRYPAQTRPSLYARAQRQGCAPVTARSTRNSALLVSFFAALPSGLPSGGGFTTISLCFLQPASA